MAKVKAIVVLSNPREVHILHVVQDTVATKCMDFGGCDDHALSRGDFRVVDKEVTCKSCTSHAVVDDHKHESGDHCVEYEVLCADALSRDDHPTNCHTCGKPLPEKYRQANTWQRDSPAPQINRRETY